MAKATIESGVLVLYGQSSEDKDSVLKEYSLPAFRPAVFYEMDTSKVFIEMGGQWYEQKPGEG